MNFVSLPGCSFVSTKTTVTLYDQQLYTGHHCGRCPTAELFENSLICLFGRDASHFVLYINVKSSNNWIIFTWTCQLNQANYNIFFEHANIIMNGFFSPILFNYHLEKEQKNLLLCIFYLIVRFCFASSHSRRENQTLAKKLPFLLLWLKFLPVNNLNIISTHQYSLFGKQRWNEERRKNHIHSI